MDKSIRIIAFNAVFTALVFITTYFVAIPNGFGGYINLGDIFILLCAACLNPLSAMIAGAIGGAMADLALGYAAFIPFTIAIKAILGLVSGLLFRFVRKKYKESNKAMVYGIIAFFIAELIVPAGYFVANWLIYDLAIGVASLVSDGIQMIIAITVTSLLCFGLKIDLMFKSIFTKKGE